MANRNVLLLLGLFNMFCSYSAETVVRKSVGVMTVKCDMRLNQLGTNIGTVEITEVHAPFTTLKISLQLQSGKLKEGLHGFHVHQFGVLKNFECKSTGGHFNPEGYTHGHHTHKTGHAGDLGNVYATKDGLVNATIYNNKIKLAGLKSIVGRSVIIHDETDDLGKGNGEDSKTSGNAGARIACCTLGVARDLIKLQTTSLDKGYCVRREKIFNDCLIKGFVPQTEEDGKGLCEVPNIKHQLNGRKKKTCSKVGKYLKNKCVAHGYRMFCGEKAPIMAKDCSPGYAHIFSKNICTQCPADKYSDDNDRCVACPQGYTSKPGSKSMNDCQKQLCETCHQCGWNTYTAENNARACVKCPRGRFSEPGSTKLSDCKPVSWSCAAGFYYNNIKTEWISPGCKECEHNTYSNDKDNFCTPCPDGLFTKGKRSSSREQCVDQVQCKPGYWFKAGKGCLICGANTYSEGNTKKCIPCPEGKMSEAGSTSRADCGCPKGLPWGKCAEDPCKKAVCANARNNKNCKANYCGGCNAVFYSSDSTHAVYCGLHGNIDEHCAPGQIWKNGKCKFCPPNTYAVADKNKCLKCLKGKSGRGSTSKEDCK